MQYNFKLPMQQKPRKIAFILFTILIVVFGGVTVYIAKKPSTPVTERVTEVLLGSKHASNFVGSPALTATSEITFTRVADPSRGLNSNNWVLNGKWEVQEDKIIARGGSTLEIKISAKNIYLVGTAPSPSKVRLHLNDAPIGQSKVSGSDVSKGALFVHEPRPYHIVAFPYFRENAILSLSVPEGVELSAFQLES